jgi:TolB protein
LCVPATTPILPGPVPGPILDTPARLPRSHTITVHLTHFGLMTRAFPLALRLGLPITLFGALLLPGCGEGTEAAPEVTESWAAPTPENARTGAAPLPGSSAEPRLRNLRQLTHGGTNAEAYFSPDGERLVFQATWPGVSQCDQIYVMDLDGSNVGRISTGQGRTTCSYFIPGRDEILFSSTHQVDPMCPTPPDRTRGYLWGLFDYDVFVRDLRTGELRRLTDTPGYDAEATLSPDGSTIVFTSMRSGDLEIWAMDADGSNPRQLTDRIGYEGGAFFSPDGSRIVFRAHYPETEEELEEYVALRDDGLIQGGRLEIFVMDADGSNPVQVTDNGASNFAPFFHPDGERIIFSSNLHAPGGRSFNLYMIGVDGTGLERITENDGFDGFPMFSPDGRHLVFASSRGAEAPGEINVFLAEWGEER